jgi:hypothetical protein
MLLSSDSWQRLAEKFEALDDPLGFVRAFKEQSEEADWRIETPRNELAGIRARCESLIARAGRDLLPPSILRDPTPVWLEELLKRKINVHLEAASIGILRLVEASAILCRMFERESISVEMLERMSEVDTSKTSGDEQRESAKPITEHPSPIMRDLGMMIEAESRARAEIHYKKTLAKLQEEEAAKTEQTNVSLSRSELRNRYLQKLPTVKILDICWAAGQHYSEWKRWLRGPTVLRDGSTPDRAFRDLLTSGKPPAEYRKVPRPKGWQ